MADVVVLKKWREQHPGRVPVRPATAGSAKLLMYNGVRYERQETVERRVELPVARVEQV